jgi:transposase
MARGRKTDRERINIALRREKAFDLRLEGKGYRDIAKELGVTVSTAWADVNAALEETATLDQDKVKTLRELELARLDGLFNGSLG